ncbi:hypothetical protein N826_35645 [Skermanella aerolata KACC 11604]|nr:hypothetical protein N826_35645 [Skermanella aerolata KACC 11604]
MPAQFQAAHYLEAPDLIASGALGVTPQGRHLTRWIFQFIALRFHHGTQPHPQLMT